MSTRSLPIAADSVQPRGAALGAWIDRHARTLLITMIVGWIVIFAIAAVRKFQQYEMGFDLALIQQIIWNTLQGRPFETFAYDFTNNILGTDSFLIHVIYLPFYAIYPNPATLLVVQTVLVGTGAIPVYLLARDFVQRRWAALAFAFVYLAYLPVMYGNLYEIRERVMAMALILWLLLCLYRRWFWRMLIPMTLALLARLDTTIGIALVGVYALLLRWPGAAARNIEGEQPATPLPWRFGLTLIGSAIAWYLFVTNIMVPSFTARPGYLFLEHYNAFGSSPGEIVWTVISQPLNTLSILLAPPRPWFLLGMFLPLAFLPLLQWRALLVMLPLYGLNYLSGRKIQWDVYHHYQGLIVPLMMLGAIIGLATLARRRVFGAHTLGIGVAAMIAGTLLSVALYGNPLQSIFDQWTPTTREISANELVARVPDGVPVATGSLLAPHLAPRRELFLVPGADFYYVADPFAKAQYAIVDMKNKQEQTATNAALQRGGWCIVDTQAEYLLLRKQPGARGELCGS